MKLQIKNLFMITAFLLLSSGCGIQTTPGEDSSHSPSTGLSRNDTPAALVSDVSSGINNGFNQAALKGMKTYSDAAGIAFAQYHVSDSGPDSCKNAILSAIGNDAELIVCVGSHFEQAVGSLQKEYKDISFLLLDGVPRDAAGEACEISPNVHCITYREEQAGYLAGYMAVLEGYRKLGFIGGEQLPPVERYGYGYLQGIDDAAAFLEISDQVQVEYWYAGTFSPDKEIEEVSLDWYQNGTEIIFACGGMLYESVLASAESCDGMLIGVDTDQSDLSERFLTSAMKGIDSSAIVALDEFFANGRKWPEKFAGKVISYGADENCISLPVQDKAWRFENATSDDYLQLLARLRSGDAKISADTDIPPETAITVTYHNQKEKDS